MFLVLLLAALNITGSHGNLACRYLPDQHGSRIILRHDGTIKFVSQEIPDNESVVKADIFDRSADKLIYEIVMVGRTDTFEVSLKSLRGTQRLAFGKGYQDKVFRLSCEN